MTPSIEVLAGVALIVTFAYTVVGLTGFGASMVAMPMLVHLLPLRLALPMMLIYDLVGGVAIGVRNRRSVDRRELLRLLPFMLVGVVLGVTVLVKAPERVLLLLLGAFVLAFAGWSLLFRPRQKPIAPGWAVPPGTVGGVFSALFGTGGPIYTIYLSRRLDALDQFRATISVVILASGLIRAAAFGAAGLYAQPEILSAAAVLLPVALIGLYGGSRLRVRVSPELLKRAIFVLLAIAGAGAIYRGWISPA